jgi:hypothetical protein
LFTFTFSVNLWTKEFFITNWPNKFTLQAAKQRLTKDMTALFTFPLISWYTCYQKCKWLKYRILSGTKDAVVWFTKNKQDRSKLNSCVTKSLKQLSPTSLSAGSDLREMKYRSR